MTLILYGIANCDTVRKARAWLGERGIDHAFHDYKRQGVPADRLDAWIGAVGWEPLLNRQGTTWRKLGEATKARVVDAGSARSLMLANASVIRRPVIERDGRVVAVGFDARAQAAVETP
jgi:Spx/MgsR family transcriptional regulator